MMVELTFYQLGESPLEALIPVLVGKALERGWRVAIQGPIPARLAFLDDRLWTDQEASFIPHGQAGGVDDARQPVLLGPPGQPANGAQMLVLVDGAEAEAAALAGYEKVCIVFDGHDAAMLAGARGQWRRYTKAGLAASYWAREDGRWQQKATSAKA